MSLKGAAVLCCFLFSFCSISDGCDEAFAALLANPHKAELSRYGAARALTLPSQSESPFKPGVGFEVISRDGNGVATQAKFRLLTDNPSAKVRLVSDLNPEGVLLEPNGKYHEGIVNVSHEMEYHLDADFGEGKKSLIDPGGELFNTPEFLASRGKQSDGALRNVFWDSERPDAYQMKHAPVDLRGKPLVISEQELHLLVAKWKGGPVTEADTYRFIAESGVIEELAKGYNAVEFLPFNAGMDPKSWEWRYQVFGNFAPNSRYGSPDDFAKMVDAFNGAGVGVIMDAVIGHYPYADNPEVGNLGNRQINPRGIHQWKRADGENLFGGVETRWQTKRYDYASPEVRKFLSDGIIHMMRKYRLSGIRVDNLDGISHYDGPGGGGKEFLQGLVKEMESEVPQALLIGEAFQKKEEVLTSQTADPENGVGFHQSINWELFDTFREFGMRPTSEIDMNRIRDVLRQSWEKGRASQFNYVTTHDEATTHVEMAHRGGATGAYVEELLGEFSPKEREGRTRAYSALMMLSGSSYLDMLQLRLKQRGTFNSNPEVDWTMLNSPNTLGFYNFSNEMSKVMMSNPAFATQNLNPDIEHHVDHKNKVIVLKRTDFKSGKHLYSIINLGDKEIPDYHFGVAEMGEFGVALDSSEAKFGGDGKTLPTTITSGEEGIYGKPHRITVPRVSPFGVVVLESQ
jgi:1,4-alpha-glucan branching enzyme